MEGINIPRDNKLFLLRKQYPFSIFFTGDAQCISLIIKNVFLGL